MKRFFSLVFVVAALAFSAACSSSPATPEDVAKKALTAIQKGDYDAYAATFDLTEEQQKQLAGMIEEKLSSKLEEKGGIKDFKILESTQEGEKANVKVEVVYSDDSTEEQEMNFVKVEDTWKQEMDK